MAITQDDLFYAFAGGIADIEPEADSLLDAITRINAPITVLVNGKSFIEPGETDRHYIIAQKWIENPVITFRNHTYGHLNAGDTESDIFQADILENEALIKKLSGRNPKYFRFPFNCTGCDSLSQALIYPFLIRQGYTITPFTIDSSDYVYTALVSTQYFMGATCDALLEGQ